MWVIIGMCVIVNVGHHRHVCHCYCGTSLACVSLLMWDNIKQKTTPLQFLDLYYSLISTVFNSSAVNIFSCVVHYIVNLISVEVYLLQVPSAWLMSCFHISKQLK